MCSDSGLLVIPNTITSLGDGCFYDHDGFFSSIVLPDNIYRLYERTLG
jgi:hypothetical protein